MPTYTGFSPLFNRTIDKREIIYEPDSSVNLNLRPKNQEKIGPLVVQTVTVRFSQEIFLVIETND